TTEQRKRSLTYIDQFKNERTPLKTKGMTPVGYRNHALAV
ncbi:IS3 family transposase, partial [Ligilactobacillus agilis]